MQTKALEPPRGSHPRLPAPGEPLRLVDRLRATWPGRRQGIFTASIASATLGLAPFVPHAHVYKQLVNLWHGQLHAPIDIWDLVMHGAPWLWLLGALAAWWVAAARSPRA